MFRFKLLLFILIAVGVDVASAKQDPRTAAMTQKNSLLRGAQEKGLSLECQLILVAVSCEYDPSDETSTNCPDVVECSPLLVVDANDGQNATTFESAHSYPFHYPSDVALFNTTTNLDQIARGNVRAIIPGGYISSDNTVIVPDESQVELVIMSASERSLRRGGDRHLTTTVGIHRVVVLRVSTRDSQPTLSQSQLYDRIFSTTIGAPTLVTQYAACSAGALQMQQRLSGTGVVDVTLSGYSSSYTNTGSMVLEATDLLIAQLNLGSTSITDFTDHVIFVIPPNPYITTSWIATAGVNSWRVVCNDDYCGFLSIFMHEVGHNLGLLHSNQNGDYNDRTGYMGSGIGVDYYPRECFNAANFWHLNWYNNRFLQVDPNSGPVKFNLVAFVDYNKLTSSDSEPLVVQIGSAHYLQYNGASSYNAETGKYPNMVVYVHDVLTSTELLAALDGSSSSSRRFVESNFEGSGHDLVLEVCGSAAASGGTPATTTVAVGYNNGDSPCTQGQWVGVSGPLGAVDCTDSSTGTFPVTSGTRTVQRTCAWLRARPRQQRSNCKGGSPARSLCPQTCNKCPANAVSAALEPYAIMSSPSSPPSASPTTLGFASATTNATTTTTNSSTTAVCNDDDKATFVDTTTTSVGRARNCFWLAKRPYLIDQYCTNDNVVRSSCRLTCNLC